MGTSELFLNILMFSIVFPFFKHKKEMQTNHFFHFVKISKTLFHKYLFKTPLSGCNLLDSRKLFCVATQFLEINYEQIKATY